jgi:hypothetical protein
VTKLRWNADAFDLISGPPGSGQLSALRSAAQAVDWHIRRGKRNVSFEREGRTYVVRTETSHETFSYLSLKEARCS